MGIVSKSEGLLAPPSDHLLSEPVIVARMATATLGSRSTVDWSALVWDYDRIRDRIARVIPDSEDFNARSGPAGRLCLFPNARRADRREWQTATGKANFNLPRDPTHVVLAQGQLS